MRRVWIAAGLVVAVAAAAEGKEVLVFLGKIKIACAGQSFEVIEGIIGRRWSQYYFWICRFCRFYREYCRSMLLKMVREI